MPGRSQQGGDPTVAAAAELDRERDDAGGQRRLILATKGGLVLCRLMLAGVADGLSPRLAASRCSLDSVGSPRIDRLRWGHGGQSAEPFGYRIADN